MKISDTYEEQIRKGIELRREVSSQAIGGSANGGYLLARGLSDYVNQGRLPQVFVAATSDWLTTQRFLDGLREMASDASAKQQDVLTTLFGSGDALKDALAVAWLNRRRVMNAMGKVLAEVGTLLDVEVFQHLVKSRAFDHDIDHLVVAGGILPPDVRIAFDFASSIEHRRVLAECVSHQSSRAEMLRALEVEETMQTFFQKGTIVLLERPPEGLHCLINISMHLAPEFLAAQERRHKDGQASPITKCLVPLDVEKILLLAMHAARVNINTSALQMINSALGEVAHNRIGRNVGVVMQPSKTKSITLSLSNVTLKRGPIGNQLPELYGSVQAQQTGQFNWLQEPTLRLEISGPGLAADGKAAFRADIHRLFAELNNVHVLPDSPSL